MCAFPGLYKRLQQANPKMLQEWERSGEKKVVVCINSAQELYVPPRSRSYFHGSRRTLRFFFFFFFFFLLARVLVFE
jgi:hypothetical protein